MREWLWWLKTTAQALGLFLAVVAMWGALVALSLGIITALEAAPTPAVQRPCW